MGKYMVMHVCGHEEEHSLFGKLKDREWRISRLEERLCSECYAEQQARLLEEEKAERGFVPLIGSEKQVDWAEKIRMSVARSLDSSDTRRDACHYGKVSEDAYEKAVEFLPCISESRFWIDHRDDDKPHLIAAINELKELNDRVETSKVEEAAAMAEMLLKPAECKSATVVDVFERDGKVCLKSDKDGDLIELLKCIGFRWNPDDRLWKHSVESAFRKGDDAVADFSNQLLAEGFMVRVNPELHDAIVNATFNPMPKRWINKTKDDGLFINIDSDEWRLVRGLPGVKPCRAGGAYVPLSAYEEVLDFAQMNGFVISDCARKVMDEFAAKVNVVNVAKKNVEEQDGSDGLAKILESSRDILDDLKDD